MKSIPDVQVETQPGSGGGGGGSAKLWTITGRLLVRESEIDGDSHDRPLKGIEVKVSASDIGADGPWTEWGTVRTDADGDFTVSETNNGKTRFFRVQARLVGPDLMVEDGTLGDLKSLDLLDKNWRTVWKSETQRDGPAVSVGTRVFASGQSLDLGNATFRRQALIWYVLRSAIDRLEAEDPWFGMQTEIRAIYPANSVRQHVLQRLRQDLPAPGPARRRLASRRCAVPLHAPVARPPHRRSAQDQRAIPAPTSRRASPRFASNALLHELWGLRLEQPLNRRAGRRRARPQHARRDRELRASGPRTRCACSGSVTARAGGATCSAPPRRTRTIDPTTTATARWTTPTRSA